MRTHCVMKLTTYNVVIVLVLINKYRSFQYMHLILSILLDNTHENDLNHKSWKTSTINNKTPGYNHSINYLNIRHKKISQTLNVLHHNPEYLLI